MNRRENGPATPDPVSFDDEPTITPASPAHRGRCGKARYGSHSAAQQALRTLQRRGKDRSFEGRLHAYPCRACCAWHVGHTRYEGSDY